LGIVAIDGTGVISYPPLNGTADKHLAVCLRARGPPSPSARCGGQIVGFANGDNQMGNDLPLGQNSK